MSGPEILTQRLRLSRLVAIDAPALFEYRSDTEVCRFQSFSPGSLADAESFIARIEANGFDTPGTWFQFAIRLRESDLVVGDIGAHFVRNDPRQVEIGFTVSPAYQRQGFGSESVSGLISYLLSDCGKHRVFASVDPRNESSVRLLRRVGMREEAHFRQSLWFKGEWVDDMVFGVLESEWGGS